MCNQIKRARMVDFNTQVDHDSILCGQRVEEKILAPLSYSRLMKSVPSVTIVLPFLPVTKSTNHHCHCHIGHQNVVLVVIVIISIFNAVELSTNRRNLNTEKITDFVKGLPPMELKEHQWLKQ